MIKESQNIEWKPPWNAGALPVELTRAKSGNAEPQLRSQEWYSRGYLPHRDRLGLLQSITFRLADSLPQEKLKELERRLEKMKNVAELGLRDPRKEMEEMGSNAELGLRVPGDTEQEIAVPRVLSYIEAERRKQIELWLDAGMGCCALKHPQMAKVLEETLLKFDGEKYKLMAWCMMPNHVHVLIEPLIKLERIIQSWKSYTGRWALTHNAELGLRVPGKALWMPDYWDRYIRNEKHLISTIDYIHNNPVKAGLCKTAEDWCWSSARFMTIEKSVCAVECAAKKQGGKKNEVWWFTKR